MQKLREINVRSDSYLAIENVIYFSGHWKLSYLPRAGLLKTTENTMYMYHCDTELD